MLKTNEKSYRNNLRFIRYPNKHYNKYNKCRTEKLYITEVIRKDSTYVLFCFVGKNHNAVHHTGVFGASSLATGERAAR